MSDTYDVEKHASIVHMMDTIVNDCRVPEGFIWAKFGRYVGQQELEWAQRFPRLRAEGIAGMIYLGADFSPSVEERCMALVGSLTRNRIRGRFFTLAEAIEAWQMDELRATCLVIPNFVDDEPGEKSKFTRGGPRKDLMSDLLLSRFRDPKAQTVLAAPSMDAISKAYGPFVRSHVEAHYTQIHPDGSDPVLQGQPA
ncbi:hypothetical protein [Roseococcus pinisoli]|uniref:Uncharacterized protein n=1 Tax=Roseococcus pinisoli TaxID=2835040 RepID=A0ABS5QF57_9PROT|nr:hypothetical protein [Roseococcus pinisoli]MBS7812329.1 hypothetical protein [Roseococcus pinisoli]